MNAPLPRSGEDGRQGLAHVAIDAKLEGSYEEIVPVVI
jgi:hypothetical protein